MKNKSQLILAVLLALLLGALFYTGLYCSDDTRYFIGVYKVAQGLPISVGNAAESRLTFLLPAALSYALFKSIFMLISPFLLYYISLVVVSYANGYLLGGQRTAYLAALAVALHPLIYVFAGSMLPDVASSLFTALSLLALLAWLDRLDNVQASLDWLLLPLAGFAIGLSAGIKESGLVFIVLPPGLFCLLFLQDRNFVALLRRTCLFALGFAAFLMLESALFYIFAGKFHSTLFNASNIPKVFLTWTKWQGFYPWERFAYLFRRVLVTFLPWTFLLPFLLAPVLIRGSSAGKNRAKLIITLSYFIWPFIYFTIGTSSLSEYIPPIMQPRYYAPCVVPAMLLLALFLAHLQEKSGTKQWQEWGIVRKTLRLLPYGVLAFMALEGLTANWDRRGTAYAAAAKISFIAAILEAQQRFPNVPIVDTPGSNQQDIMRCRKILLEHPNLSHELLQGRFVYSDIESLQPPFILIGHGDYWNTPKANYIQKIQEKVERGDWRVLPVGYQYLTRNDLFFSDLNAAPALQRWVQFDRISVKNLNTAKQSGYEKRLHVETYLVEKSAP